MKINLKPNETLVLRTCKNDGTSRNNFRWPERGPVKCPDWKPTKECGNGLHGALMGQGNGRLFNWHNDALWQVVRVNKNKVIDINGKVKFPKGYVCYTGDRKTATDIIIAHKGTNVIGAMVTVGDKGIAIVGHRGIATAGNYGTAMTGDYGTAMAGYGGTATAGNNGAATAGICGAATAGICGTATAGICGTATAGYGGTATAGDYGTATAGEHGLATAGHYGIIQIKFWDKNKSRSRLVVGYIGENGLEPNVKYKLDEKGNFVKVT